MKKDKYVVLSRKGSPIYMDPLMFHVGFVERVQLEQDYGASIKGTMGEKVCEIVCDESVEEVVNKLDEWGKFYQGSSNGIFYVDVDGLSRRESERLLKAVQKRVKLQKSACSEPMQMGMQTGGPK